MAAIFYYYSALKTKFQDMERGATAVEYALVIGLVSLVLIAAIIGLGGGLTDVVAKINAYLTGAATTVPVAP